MIARTVPSSILSSWTCRTCLVGRSRAPNAGHMLRQQLRRKSDEHTGFSVPPMMTRADRAKARTSTTKVVVAGATLLILGGAAMTDQGQHFFGAVRRTIRVITTLAICVNDYRTTLKHENDPDFETLLRLCHKRCASLTLDAMEKNGSIFIKLGQHLSSLTYLLPSEWCDTFIPLQDRCPTSSYQSIEAMVKKDTGHALSDFFESFDPVPIGAASLAQVHRAVVRDTGEPVAVKLQHPSLDEWAPLDLALTEFTFATLRRFFPEYDLTWLSEEMQVSLPQELDFNREAQNAVRARNYFSEVKGAPLVIPRVLWAKRRILVMEYVTGHRPDDLEYLDSHGIDRDEVSAALARIFNEMIFGANAPLHCDPHGGNIAVRYNPDRWRKANFDIVLYDHGLYRDLPVALRRSYAKLWLAVLENNIPKMRRYAYEVAGIEEDNFELFASAITGRDFSVLSSGGVDRPRNEEERKVISDALGDGLLAQLVQLLGKVPRVLLLVLKTNDLTRSLDENLHTRQGPARTFLILARYASRCVYDERLEAIDGNPLWPSNWVPFLKAFTSFARVELRLSLYERWLQFRRLLGMAPVAM